MVDLLRSNIGDPSTPLGIKPDVKVNKTSQVLSQLSALGAGATQMYQKEHEVSMTRQAKNDVVNNTINPDLQIHEGAYAQTVAKGQALKGYNALNQEIMDGVYKDTSPEDFQKLMTEKHKEYKSGVSKNKFSTLEAAEYDSFWFENEATITAGQAGMYRKNLEVKQGIMLNDQLGSLVQAPVTPTAAEIMKTALTPESTLLNEDDRITAMLVAGIDLARQKPEEGLQVLKDLDAELHFSTDPQRHIPFNAALKVTRKAISNNKNRKSREETYNIIAGVDKLEQDGMLYDSHWSLVKDDLDANNNPIFTPASFKAKVNRSAKERAKNNVAKSAKSDFKAGLNTDLTKEQFSTTADGIYKEFMLASSNDSISSIENMGRLLVNQADKWDALKDRATMFNRELLIVGKEVNKDALHRYKELAALERGMGFDNQGKKVFADYLGESLPQYLEIKEALNLTKDTEEGAWIAVAESLKLREETAKKRKNITSVSVEAATFGAEVSDSIWQHKDNPWLPNILEEAFVPDIGLDRVANVVAKAYDSHIQDGWSEDVSKIYAERKGHSQVYKWGGELYDTRGQDPKVLFGTSDPDGAFNTMIQDPQWNAIMKDMFGVTLGDMVFGVGDAAVTEEDVRKQEKKRAESSLFLQKKNIIKQINLVSGTLDFRSTEGEGTIMSIPLLDIGRAHEASLQNNEDIDRLERLYGTEFQSTEAGKQWATDQEVANDKFLTNVLGTDKSYGRTTTTSTEYADMTPMEQTRNRLQFHKDTYSGVTGKLFEIADFFNLKREVGNITYGVPTTENR